ncbi:nucleotidyltransferase family protein [Candidatus Halobonum tyrrellensis]|uniref:UDP-N-acetylglucosamine pyrophosphorylase n=1 Tax=Candidatus Halobonum tyrrellensis G22 TaxID=1324957 RepID=V4HQA1_9EURY|nr:nucleotidyltransferase family protein [Candidatus Halobonum tyrrellensis]ESP90094.1 UDP-N-acetylglucosamine pyrophosphorylase [Candidatus Halobonum tyrrellensis G22]
MTRAGRSGPGAGGDRERRVGVLLAAGTGSRFDGGNKLRRPLDGDPVVRRAARRLADAPVDETVVVVGHDADRVREALGPLAHRDRVAVVRNDRYDEGQGASVRRGAAAALERGGTAGLFALGDMPLVAPGTYDRLVAVADRETASVVVPEYRGDRGNPVAFDARALRRLTTLSGDVGGRALFGADEFTVVRVPVDDPGVRADVDTAADLERYRRGRTRRPGRR